MVKFCQRRCVGIIWLAILHFVLTWRRVLVQIRSEGQNTKSCNNLKMAENDRNSGIIRDQSRFVLTNCYSIALKYFIKV